MADDAKSSIVWLSFDLGIRGDYEGLYKWLDEQDARECGNSIAVFSYASKGDIAAEIKAELKKSVSLDKRSRIYLIFRDSKSRKNKGIFILGGRKSPPWTGYGQTNTELVDEEV